MSVGAKRILRAEALNSWVHIDTSPESFHKRLMILFSQAGVGTGGICILQNSPSVSNVHQGPERDYFLFYSDAQVFVAVEKQ